MDIKELLAKLSIPEEKEDSASAAIREFLNGAYVGKSHGLTGYTYFLSSI